MTQRAPVTLFYDGSCPLCVAEIGLLRRFDKDRGGLVFEDVSPAGAAPSCPIDRQTLMERFHARLPDGTMVSGARAFTEAWGQLKGMGWVKPLGRWWPTRAVLDVLYRGFLKIRPSLQRFARRRSSNDGPAAPDR